MKKFCTLFFSLLLCSTFLTACGEPEVTAASSVKAIYDFYILGDTEGISSLGMSDEYIRSAQTAYNRSVKESIRANFSASGQEITDTALDTLCDARKEAFSKLSATAEVTAESEGKATVVLHTTYFDEAALDKEAFQSMQNDVFLLSESIDDEIQPEELMEIYTEYLIESYKNVKPSKDTTDVTVECVIQNEEWVPASMSSFGSDLSLAITGQSVSPE